MSASSSHQHQKEESLLLYALTPTATPTSLSSLPLQSVKTGHGQLRHTWPQMAASSAASFSTNPSSTFATATATASTPNLSGSSNSSNRTDTLPTLPPRKIQFAGDVLEDWLFADSILNADLTTVTLTRSLIAAELDSLPNSASQTPTGEKRHIRSAGSDSDVLPAGHRTTQSAPGSAKATHIAFLSLPASHNSAGALKPQTRSTSPAPAARSRPLGSAKPLPTSLPSTPSDPDLEQANLLLTRHMRITSRSQRAASQSFACRLRHFRQQIQKQRFQKLSARISSSAPSVHAHNARAVKSWVSEQRGMGARTEEAWKMADL